MYLMELVCSKVSFIYHLYYLNQALNNGFFAFFLQQITEHHAPNDLIESYFIWSIEISFAVLPWEIFDRIWHFSLKEN